MKTPGRIWAETVVEAMGARPEQMGLGGFVWLFNVLFLAFGATVLWAVIA